MFPHRTTVRTVVVMATLLLAAPIAAEPKPTPGAAPQCLPLAVDAITLLDLPGDISTVIIANPQIADASVLGPRRLYLLGRKPGQTGLMVVGADGAPLLRATVIVAPAEPPLRATVMVAPADLGVVTVDRGTHESTLSCSPRCVAIDEGKSGADAVGASPSPPAPPLPPSPGPTTDTPSGPAPRLKPPALETNP